MGTVGAASAGGGLSAALARRMDRGRRGRLGGARERRAAAVRRGRDDGVIAEEPSSASRRPAMRALRRRTAQRPEGRWSLLAWGRPETEALAVFQASLLLQRYGFAARELALLDPWLLPWRVL